MSAFPDLARVFRRRLSAGDWQRDRIFSRLEENFARCEQIVRLFYLMMVFFIYDAFSGIHNVAYNNPAFDLRWPLAWARGLNMLVVTDVLGVACFVTGLLAALCTGTRIFRIAFALLLLPLVSIPSSLGTIHHTYHMAFWMSAALALLPVARGRAGRMAYCFTFAGAQGLMLSFYTMAGMHKAKAGLTSLLAGEEGNFSPRGLAMTLAERSEQTGTLPLLGHYLIEHYWLAWPIFVILIYAQFIAVITVVRPSLHVAIGLLLVFFHLGTFLLMEITFPAHILVLLLFMVQSPFRRVEGINLRAFGFFPGPNWLLRQRPFVQQPPAAPLPATNLPA